MINIQQIHHVAYRCRDAKETVEWYQKHLNMKFLLAISEDKVPSTRVANPYMHVFLDAGNDNVLAFFELADCPEMQRDPNTPDWVQHIAFNVADLAALESAKEELEGKGIDVVGITHHGIVKSIYFFDPNGHRLELTCRIDKPGQLERLHQLAPEMLEQWSKTKRVPKDAAWLYEEEFS